MKRPRLATRLHRIALAFLAGMLSTSLCMLPVVATWYAYVLRDAPANAPPILPLALVGAGVAGVVAMVAVISPLWLLGWLFRLQRRSATIVAALICCLLSASLVGGYLLSGPGPLNSLGWALAIGIVLCPTLVVFLIWTIAYPMRLQSPPPQSHF